MITSIKRILVLITGCRTVWVDSTPCCIELLFVCHVVGICIFSGFMISSVNCLSGCVGSVKCDGVTKAKHEGLIG